MYHQQTLTLLPLPPLPYNKLLSQCKPMKTSPPCKFPSYSSQFTYPVPVPVKNEFFYCCTPKRQIFQYQHPCWGKKIPVIITDGMRLHYKEFIRALIFLASPPRTRFMRELQVERIPKGYIPSQLVGQWGVKCTTFIPVNTILGEYEGRFYIGNSISNDYCLGGVAPDGRKYTINPMQGGNGVFEYCNDFRVDVMRAVNYHVNDRNRINVNWMVARRGLEPHILIVTTKPLRPGDWLLIDYGPKYWTARFPQLK